MKDPMHERPEIREDVVLFVEQIRRMDHPTRDEQRERQRNQKGVWWGWTISIWFV